MATGPTSHFDSHFQDIFDNINVELIAPLLVTSGIIHIQQLHTFRGHLKTLIIHSECIIRVK